MSTTGDTMYVFKHWQKRNFWDKVSVTGLDQCWEWKGGINSGGYAQFCLNNKSIHSHRLSYFLTRGEIPEGAVIRHRCDNRKCVNPTHLLSGSHQDNTNDMFERNRFPRGETSGMSKLTDEQAISIRNDKRKRSEIAREYGISEVTVKRIQLKYCRKHL